MLRTLMLILVSLLPLHAHADDLWWTYLASYEDNKPGSTRVNLGLKSLAPVDGYPYLIVTGTSYKGDKTSGLPVAHDFELLDDVYGKVVQTIAAVSPSIYAGTFTNDHQQLHYIYVKNATGVEAALREMYENACPDCKIYVNVKRDPTWFGFNKFLYPNQPTLDFYRAELVQLGAIKQ